MSADRSASVLARLLNRSRSTGDSYNLLLSRFAIERLLHRLSVSPHVGNFVLKGALLFALGSTRRTDRRRTPTCWASAQMMRTRCAAHSPRSARSTPTTASDTRPRACGSRQSAKTTSTADCA